MGRECVRRCVTEGDVVVIDRGAAGEAAEWSMLRGDRR